MSMKPYGITLFCDDFRQEVTGKYILIGGYTNELTINGKAPVLLPSLAIIFHINIPINYKFSLVKLEAVFEGEEGEENLLEVEINWAPKEDNERDDDSTVDEARRMSIIFAPHIISPLTLKGNGLISTRAYFDDEMIRIGSLRVAFKEQENNS